MHVKALLRRAKLPPISSHDLRHTFATLQLAAGTNPKIVSEVLGHKDIAITLDRYSHALPTLQAKAMARLDAILGRGDDAQPVAGAIRAPGRDQGDNGCDPNSDRPHEDAVGTAHRSQSDRRILPTTFRGDHRETDGRHGFSP